MVDHCENCNCANVKKYCGMEKFWYINLLLMCGIPFFIGTSFLVFYVIRQECSSRWSEPEYLVCGVCYSSFVICYMMMFQVTNPFLYIGLLISWIFEYIWEAICNIWNCLRLPTWSGIRQMFSIRRIARTQTKQDISICHNESNEDTPPPLPPKKRKMAEADRTTMFQKMTSNVSQGASTSYATNDESADFTSSLFHRPHCSKQSASSVESSGRRGKKLSKRGHIKKMTSNVTKLNAIHKEGLDTQGASGVKMSFSSLNQNSASDNETEQETSFTTNPHQSGAAAQDFVYANTDESDKPVPTQRVYGVEAQAKTSSTGGKQTDPDQISRSLRSTKKQLSIVQDFFTQSPEQSSTSGFLPHLTRWNQTSSHKQLGSFNAPISKFGSKFKFEDVPLSTFQNPVHEQTFVDVYSGPQGEEKESIIQCQSSASYMRLPESESQSKAFDIRGTEGNINSLHQPPESAELQDTLSHIKEQSFAFAFSGSQEQTQLSDIQNSQGNRDQAAANYVKLPQLENLLVSDIRTEMKQSSPEQSAIRDVQTSLQGQVSSIPGIQRMPTYQGQSSSAGPQRQGRTSDVQKRRSSRKHNPIPVFRKSSESESESEEERLNLQQPTQCCAQFSLAKSQLQTSGIGEFHKHISQERGLHDRTLQDTSTPWIPRTCKTLEKLKKLQQASAAGFPEATIQTRHVGEGHELPLSADYAKKLCKETDKRNTQRKETFLTFDMAAGGLVLCKDGAEDHKYEADSSEPSFMFNQSINVLDLSHIEVPLLPKHITPSKDKGESQNSEISIPQSSIKTKRIEGPAESASQLFPCTRGGLVTSNIQRQQIGASAGCYLPHSTLLITEGNPTQQHATTTPLEKGKECDDRKGQRPLTDSSRVKEEDKQEIQRT